MPLLCPAAAGMAINRTVTVLDLAGNSLASAGVTARALPLPSAPRGSGVAAQVLSTAPAVRATRADASQRGAHRPQVLLEALTECGCVKRIDISQNGAGQARANLLVSALRVVTRQHSARLLPPPAGPDAVLAADHSLAMPRPP